MDIGTAADADALIGLTGLGEGEVPTITNHFSTTSTVTIDAPSDPSAEFDIGNTGNFSEVPVTFSVAAGGTVSWSLSATTDPLPVVISVVHGNGSVKINRDVVVPEAGQFDVIVDVASTGSSGRLSFTARNEGTRDAVVTGIRIDDTSTDVVEVSHGDIFLLQSSAFAEEPARQLIADPLVVGDSSITKFDNNDTVVIPHTAEELTFQFDRFRRPPGPGSPNADMRNSLVTITLRFSDGSQRQFEIDDS